MRFFARVRTFDIACPVCDQVDVIRKGKPSWNNRIGRWTCSHCRLTLAIGLVAYRVELGPARPAGDRVPTVREAFALRTLGKWEEERKITNKGPEESVNVYEEGGDPDKT